MRKFLPALALCVFLPGCVAGIVTKTQGAVNVASDALVKDLTAVANTNQSDIGQGIIAAGTVLPSTGKAVDPDGVACLTAIKTVNADVLAILANAQGTVGSPASGTTAAVAPTGGAITTAEVASIFIPNGQFYNNEKQILVTGCAAKAQDMLGAQASLLGPAAVIQNLAALAPVVAPALAAVP